MLALFVSANCRYVCVLLCTGHINLCFHGLENIMFVVQSTEKQRRLAIKQCPPSPPPPDESAQTLRHCFQSSFPLSFQVHVFLMNSLDLSFSILPPDVLRLYLQSQSPDSTSTCSPVPHYLTTPPTVFTPSHLHLLQGRSSVMPVPLFSSHLNLNLTLIHLPEV